MEKLLELVLINIFSKEHGQLQSMPLSRNEHIFENKLPIHFMNLACNKASYQCK